MENNTKSILTIAAVITVVMALFPPSILASSSIFGYEYRFIGDIESFRRVEFFRLIVQIALVWIVAFLALIWRGVERLTVEHDEDI